MRMSGIKMLGLATVLAGGIGLTSCNMLPDDASKAREWAIKAKREVANTNALSTKRFTALCDSTNDMLWVDEAKVWVNEQSKIKNKKSFDAGKQFVRDSLTNVAKIAKRIKK